MKPLDHCSHVAAYYWDLAYLSEGFKKWKQYFKLLNDKDWEPDDKPY